jgi:hypothetical protein
MERAMPIRFRYTFRTKVRLCNPANPQGKSTAAVPWGSFCAGCPHQAYNPRKPKDADGFCALLNVADWHAGEFPLLFDGVKICGFRHENGPEEPPGWRSSRQPRFRDRPRFHRPWGGWKVIFSRDIREQVRRSPRAAGWRLRRHGPFGL